MSKETEVEKPNASKWAAGFHCLAAILIGFAVAEFDHPNSVFLAIHKILGWLLVILVWFHGIAEFRNAAFQDRIFEINKNREGK